MEYEYYNPFDEKSGCIVRAISSALNRNYNDIKSDLIGLSIKLKKDDYHDIEVFETYLFNNCFEIINDYTDILIKDLKLDSGNYVIFCYKDAFYHMVSVINNTLYDKNDEALNLKVLKIYKYLKK